MFSMFILSTETVISNFPLLILNWIISVIISGWRIMLHSSLLKCADQDIGEMFTIQTLFKIMFKFSNNLTKYAIKYHWTYTLNLCALWARDPEKSKFSGNQGQAPNRQPNSCNSCSRILFFNWIETMSCQSAFIHFCVSFSSENYIFVYMGGKLIQKTWK